MSFDHYIQQVLPISPKELKKRLDVKKPLIVFDIGSKDRYNRDHIPSSWFISHEHRNTVKNLLTKLPRDIDVILVGDNDDESYFKETIAAILENNVEQDIR
ncbi:MAG: rhodanese-like domain-containing protein, partial [Nitrososphaeraceae archaeon]